MHEHLKQPLHSRRTFLVATSATAISLGLPIRHQATIYVADGAWPYLKYEPNALEIVGSDRYGASLLPNFDKALVREVQRVTGVRVLPENILGLERINGCGLFRVVVSSCGFQRQYRLWNYLVDEPPKYSVTRAGD